MEEESEEQLFDNVDTSEYDPLLQPILETISANVTDSDGVLLSEFRSFFGKLLKTDISGVPTLFEALNCAGWLEFLKTKTAAICNLFYRDVQIKVCCCTALQC